MNRENSLKYKASTDEYGGVILLYFKAIDSQEIHDKKEFRNPVLKTYGAKDDIPFSKQQAYYSNLLIWVKSL